MESSKPIHKIAKELGLDTNRIILACKNLGIYAKGSSKRLNSEEIDKIINYFKSGKNVSSETIDIGEKNLNILGLMAIPPNDENTLQYFKHLNNLNASLGLKELSMGMSSDYLDAIKFNATFVRIGSSIFGPRS